MSIAVMTQVWARSRSQGNSLLVLLALADHADDEGVSYPSIPNLAKKCRVSERTAQRAIRELVAMGELTVYPNKGIKTKLGWTNQYRINLQNLRWQHDTPSSNVVTFEAGGGDTAGPQKVTTVSPKPSEESSVEPSEAPAACEPTTLVLQPTPTRRARRGATPELPLPSAWSADLRAAWDAWTEHCKALRKAITPPAARELFAQIDLMGEARAIAAIRLSIREGWRSIHEGRQWSRPQAGVDPRFAGAL